MSGCLKIRKVGVKGEVTCEMQGKFRWWIFYYVVVNSFIGEYAKTHQTVILLLLFYYFKNTEVLHKFMSCLHRALISILSIVSTLVYVLLKGTQTVNLNMRSLLYISIPQLAVKHKMPPFILKNILKFRSYLVVQCLGFDALTAGVPVWSLVGKLRSQVLCQIH